MGGGGLTGQYSTSMPASGGYFPDVNQLPDEAANARKERQKQREEKRKALKAAWGTDTREHSQILQLHRFSADTDQPSHSKTLVGRLARAETLIVGQPCVPGTSLIPP